MNKKLRQSTQTTLKLKFFEIPNIVSSKQTAAGGFDYQFCSEAFRAV